ncbi:hypothetical protein LINGRAHAP2_LOCUS5792, partial [Linum grandiflorum]
TRSRIPQLAPTHPNRDLVQVDIDSDAELVFFRIFQRAPRCVFSGAITVEILAFLTPQLQMKVVRRSAAC